MWIGELGGGWESPCVEGRRRGPRQGLGPPATGLGGASGPLSPHCLPQRTHRRVGRVLGRRPPADSLSPACPLCDLGQVPTCLAHLCHVCNRDGAAVTYMSWLHRPRCLFNPVRLGKLSSHRCGSGEMLSLRVLCFPQRFSPCGSSQRVSFIFL